jgi:hypothetical protein
LLPCCSAAGGSSRRRPGPCRRGWLLEACLTVPLLRLLLLGLLLLLSSVWHLLLLSGVATALPVLLPSIPTLLCTCLACRLLLLLLGLLLLLWLLWLLWLLGSHVRGGSLLLLLLHLLLLWGVCRSSTGGRDHTLRTIP